MNIQQMIDNNLPLPAGLTQTGNLVLGSYAHPLPAGLTRTGILYLGSYAHPLPAGLTQTGDLDLGSYAHPLPAGLTQRIRDDVFAVLDSAPSEVPFLLGALRAGRVDGSTYDGDCCCLVGTLEVSGAVSLPHDSKRPAEQFFMNISSGDTPDTCRAARMAEEWGCAMAKCQIQGGKMKTEMHDSAKFLTKKELVEMLEKRLANMSLRAAAAVMGVSHQAIDKALKQDGPLGKQIPTALGYEAITFYKPLPQTTKKGRAK